MANAHNKTRQKVKCPVFGNPCEFRGNVLPTKEDVMRQYAFTLNEMKTQNETQCNPSFKKVADVVVPKLKEVWTRASLPTVSLQQIVSALRIYHLKYINVKKSVKRGWTKTMKAFVKNARESLFDISACKCKEYDKCSCPSGNKVPAMERTFLSDQRTERKMCIASVDKISAKKQKRREERFSVMEKRKQKMELEKEEFGNRADQMSSDTGSSSESEMKFDSEMDFYINEPHSSNNIQMRMPMPLLAEAADRTGVSDRSAALIASAVLADANLITKDSASFTVDRSKVRRERNRRRKETKKEDVKSRSPLKAMYFDGRKDKTLTMEERNGKQYQKVITEEHIVLIQEPHSQYIGHIAPSSGSALNITNTIFDMMERENITLSSLHALGCDGTSTNTGNQNGVIRLIEKRLSKPLQWFICLLHANELPLMHLMKSLDGVTTGPYSYSGPIGIQLKTCENLPVVKFKSITTTIPFEDIDTKLISCDQKYLLDISRVVNFGECPSNVAERSPGKLSHARWLTCANRILRLYIATKKPSETLVTLATYVMRVYAPVWFAIKLKPSSAEGARHIWKLVFLSRSQSKFVREIIDPVIQRNAYFAHPENLLISMLGDSRPEVRKKAVDMILQAKTAEREQCVRPFIIPTLNFSAKEYVQLVNLENEKITFPPVLNDVSEDTLQQLANNTDKSNLPYYRYPCHTQAVERAVKEVTDASLRVFGHEARDGLIRSRLRSRARIPKLETKGQANFSTNREKQSRKLSV